MDKFLEQVDAAPLYGLPLDPQLFSWLTVMIEILNYNFIQLEKYFRVPVYSDTEISYLQTNGLLQDGAILYDNVNNKYVGRISGTLVSFTTGTYP